jgi:signal transduction histidine kinase/integral membrane sensor domain MASE1
MTLAAAPPAGPRRVPLAPGVRLGLIMAGVWLGYYVGSVTGLTLRIPPATTSVLWPPNTVLTFALLITPPRRWLWCLVAALSAHLMVQGGIGWQFGLVAALFGTNSLEALIAAYGFRRAAGPEPRLDTLRRMLLFMAIVGVAAPVVSGFVDAAVVWAHHGEPYVAVLRRRLSSNVLTALTVLPALLTLTYRLPRWIHRAQPRRWVEALGLTTALVVAASVAFSPPRVELGGVPVLLPTPLVVLLPFLLWAAVRFGTSGASLALAFTVFSAVASAITQSRPQDPLSAETAVLALQISLITLAVPLLAFAALVEERYRARAELASRLAFESVLSQMASRLVAADHTRTGDVVTTALRELAAVLPADALVLVDRPARRLPQLLTSGPRVDAADEPAIAHLLETTDPVREGPQGAASTLDGHWWALPLSDGPTPAGTLAVLTRDRTGPERLDRCRQAAGVLGRTLARARADAALRQSEGVMAAILAAIPTGVALLTDDGRIVSVNAQWQAFADDPRVVTAAGATSGNFVDLCRAAVIAGLGPAESIRGGVEDVLAARRASLVVDYPGTPETLDRWFTFRAVRLAGGQGGAVLTNTEITDRRRAELSAQRTRDELAHVTRVTAMGELTTSLAQQLQQPLDSIRSRAAAARALLTDPAVDAAALDLILAEIVEAGRQAVEVIGRLRALLRKERPSRVPVDLVAVVRETLALVASDAAARKVRLESHLPNEPLTVTGDRVQLVQVLLNVAMNAMESMAAIPDAERVLRVKAEAAYGAGLVTVRDAGPGINGNVEGVFAPFFTTKPDGLGMGLAIARNIAEAHQGRIWAADHPDGGAQFFVSIPLREG